jgi:hypothetical protein
MDYPELEVSKVVIAGLFPDPFHFVKMGSPAFFSGRQGFKDLTIRYKLRLPFLSGQLYRGTPLFNLFDNYSWKNLDTGPA